MKWIFPKISGIVAASLSLISVLLVVICIGSAIGTLITYRYGYALRGLVLGSWMLSIFFSLLSFPFYIGDAVCSIIKAVKDQQRCFHIIFAIMIPLAFLIFVILNTLMNIAGAILWSFYALGLVAMEVWSIFLARRYYWSFY